MTFCILMMLCNHDHHLLQEYFSHTKRRPPYCCLVSKSCPTLCNPMYCRPPGSVGFSRQEYWSGLLFPTPGDIPNPEIEPESPSLADGFFTTELPANPNKQYHHLINSYAHSPQPLATVNLFSSYGFAYSG